ncbi:unnamed protein product, partial [Aphanomyces euteiches]
MDEHMDHFVEELPVPTSFRYFYKLVTLIATNVWTQANKRLDTPVENNPPPDIVISYRQGDVAVPFKSWTTKIIKRVSFHAPLLTRPHPFHSSTRETRAKIAKYLSQCVKPFASLVTPVQADLWTRILYDIIPVGDKFKYKEATDPRALRCCYTNCYARETLRHLFMECTITRDLWLQHREAWSLFGVRFTWEWIENIDAFQVAQRWTRYQD